MKRDRLLVVLVLMVGMTACQRGTDAPAAFAPTGRPTYTLANTPEHWCKPISEVFGDSYCTRGEFDLLNHGFSSDIMIVTAGDFKNFMVEAQMRSIGTSGSYGLGFRGNDQMAMYYIFRVQPSGQFQFIFWSPDGIHVLLPWTSSPALHTGEAANRLQVIAQGNRITLSANGERLATVQDNARTQGSLGPTAMEGAHAVMSSLSVWELP